MEFHINSKSQLIGDGEVWGFFIPLLSKDSTDELNDILKFSRPVMGGEFRLCQEVNETAFVWYEYKGIYQSRTEFKLIMIGKNRLQVDKKLSKEEAEEKFNQVLKQVQSKLCNH